VRSIKDIAARRPIEAGSCPWTLAFFSI